MGSRAIFDEEGFINYVAEQSALIQQQIKPIIDQLVLIRLRQESIPPSMDGSEGVNRYSEFQNMQEYYVNLLHKIIGYDNNRQK